MSDFLAQLIEAEKAVVRAPAGAKDAAWAAIERSLAAGVVPPVDLGSSAAIGWIAAIIGGASMLAVVGYLGLRPPDVKVTPLPPPAPVVVDDPLPPPAELPVPLPPPAKRAPRLSLALQIQELRKAQQAFARGHPEIALTLVEAHRSKFPKTPLEQERSALEALAACRVRRADALELKRKFLAAWPRSPQADRVRNCNPG